MSFTKGQGSSASQVPITEGARECSAASLSTQQQVYSAASLLRLLAVAKTQDVHIEATTYGREGADLLH